MEILLLNHVHSKQLFDLLNQIFLKHHRENNTDQYFSFIDSLLFRYPVILDIENHCSKAQQKEMARILKEVLGCK
jgi:hypothetical protein